MPRRPQNLHEAYHAHVYFDAGTVDEARALVAQAGNTFNVQVGRVHGLTGDDLADHTSHAYWLGNEWPLDVSMFQRSASA